MREREPLTADERLAMWLLGIWTVVFVLFAMVVWK